MLGKNVNSFLSSCCVQKKKKKKKFSGLLPAIEDGHMLNSCLEMMAHRKRGIDKEKGY